MQQRMDIFASTLPLWLQRRTNYAFSLNHLGQVLYNVQTAPEFFVYAVNGIRNLDINPNVRTPHLMLLAMNTSEILELYALTWLAKNDPAAWEQAVNKKDFWQVVSAVLNFPVDRQRLGPVLAALSRLGGKTYPEGSERGSLQNALKQLPPSVGNEFMKAFTHPLQGPDPRLTYVSLGQWQPALTPSLDQIIYDHFAQRFKEGEGPKK